MNNFSNIIIVCGHYGCGKTNFAVNLAVDYAARGEKVTLFDLDIVNPYFRSSDHKALMEEKGVELIAPLYAGSNVDTPSVPAAMYSMTERQGRVIVDVGGDDAGAVALGRFAPRLWQCDYTMLCVINKYRALSTMPEETSQLLGEIEAASRLKATALINNSHLMQETDAQAVLSSLDYAQRCSELTGLPVALNCVRRELAEQLEIENIYPVDIYVRPPWLQ